MNLAQKRGEHKSNIKQKQIFQKECSPSEHQTCRKKRTSQQNTTVKREENEDKQGKAKCFVNSARVDA
jgi:hypothetical protein